MNDRTAIDEILIEGIVDWVDLSWICQCTLFTPLRDPVERKLFAIGALVELMFAGLMVPGDVDERGVHLLWDISVGEAIVRIVREWQDWPEGSLTPGAVVWMANTAEGDRRAREILQRDGESAIVSE